MATISENLQTIKNSTDAIKQAIIDKGGEISGNITTWADAIGGIEVGGGSSSTEITFTGDMSKVGDEPVTFTISGYISTTLDLVSPFLVAIFITPTLPSIARSFIPDITEYLTLSLNTQLSSDMMDVNKRPILYLASGIDNTIYPVTFIQQSQGGLEGGNGV